MSLCKSTKLMPLFVRITQKGNDLRVKLGNAMTFVHYFSSSYKVGILSIALVLREQRATHAAPQHPTKKMS